jgi:hypothetical protein
VKLPNKMLQDAYDAAVGKVFKWSPTNYKFTDQHGYSEYNYHAMLWLKDNGYFIQNIDHLNFVWLFKLKG